MQILLIQYSINTHEARTFQTSAGYLEATQGNYDKALEMFQKGNPENPLNIYRTAMAYEKKGDKDNAKKWYQAVVNWNWTGFSYAIARPQALKKIK